ncbi:MAG: hypothetical protein IPP15_20375 [Saprospiraceae bacterium]|uniref:Uncharacterized protein n=1 Tax=Candidatus Opimibacter skivensis TaxID=2982028 RepID=A0A9D7XVH1_9BACT|nr:hypothetical protein [Candidatus Opimibacter skivensis]
MKGYLFMYRYLSAGQEFMFNLDSNRKDLLDIIKSKLHGKEFKAAKSKRNEFGKISIEFMGEEVISNNATSIDGRVVFYAESDLCFLDEYENYTTHLSSNHFGIRDGRINYGLTRISTRRYYPYNHYRNTYDPERIVIAKGSVITIDDVDSATSLPLSVGIHRSEGLGHVLINEDWLLKDFPPLRKRIALRPTPFVPEIPIHLKDEGLIRILQNQKKLSNQNARIDSLVFDFMHLNLIKIKVAPSQWGKIYNDCVSNKSIEEIIDSLGKGRSKQKWAGKQENLQNFLTEDGREALHPKLLMKISRQMQKDKVLTNSTSNQN